MTTTMVRVISLESAQRRRERFTGDAAAATIEWEFFAACTGPAAPLTYDPKGAIRRAGRKLSPGELGCYASHYKIWEAFLQSDADQIIVLEDDVLVDWALLARLAAHDFSGGPVDLLRFYSTHPFRYKIASYRFLSPHSHLVRAEGSLLGTQGYLLTRRAAEALLSLGTTMVMPIDWLMALSWRHKLPNYCLFPFPILERYVPSSIGSTGREEGFHATPIDKLARLVWMVRHKAMQTLANRRHAKAAAFGALVDTGPAVIDRV
jgi:glycosyl transferase family 25